jgi:dTDP-glucose 4,6-dehydratase
MRLLITGGAGFIGSNFVHHILKKYPEYEITVLDKLTYAGRIENLQDVLDKIEFIKGDMCKKEDVEKAIKDCDMIVHFAAETHVDRSIFYGEDFIRTDVLGTFMLLEAARKFEVEKFVHISTDEVYGSIEKGSFREDDKFDPSSPYSASKAGADLLCQAYFKTYGLPILIARPSNNYGPYQHPEKFIPKMIIYALLNKPLPVYGKGENVRSWLYVRDCCEGIETILHKGKIGEAYNVGSPEELKNIEVVKMILKELNKPESLIQFVKDRPGHDLRYSLNIEKIKKLGWEPRTCFEEGLEKTIKWYKNNERWWKPLLKDIDFWKKW